ncbi:MAG: hypothetical protein P8175_19605, partial [Deltaproteobacteria bacterium]
MKTQPVPEFLTPDDVHISARIKKNKNGSTELQTLEETSGCEGGKLWSPKGGSVMDLLFQS